MHRTLIAALTLAAAAALAACSSAGSPTATAAGAGSGAGGGGGTATQAAGGGSGGGGATTSDPCSLLTQQEAAAAVGSAVGPGTNAPDSHECEWNFPNNDSPTASGAITIQDGDLASFCGKPSDPALGLNIEPVSGIGDGACFTYVTGTTVGSSLTFAKNGHVYSTAAYFGGGTPIDKVETAAKALALAALNHL